MVRVISRLLRLGGDRTGKVAQQAVAAAAAQLLSPARPGCFNQAGLNLANAPIENRRTALGHLYCLPRYAGALQATGIVYR